MAETEHAILLDADAIILLKEFEAWPKVLKKLGKRAWIAEVVACKEVKFYKDRVTGRKHRFTLGHLSDDSIPRMIKPEKLSNPDFARYQGYFGVLEGADPGERETFALAWVLGADVCSQDVNAAEIFRANRPKGCVSRHLNVMDLLRSLKLA